MSSSIKNVAVAGASGNIGAPTVRLLHEAGFNVTVLTRADSSATFPDYASVKAVDYTSIPSLTDALRGIDAVVCTLGYFALAHQPNLVSAASLAGARRFIPCEYSADLLNAKTREFAALAGKIAVQEQLKTLAAAEAETGRDRMTYSLLFTGLFLDWGLEGGFIINVKDRSATLYDGGDRVVSFTTTTTIARAIVGCLLHPAQTANRAVYVQDIATTQSHMIALAKELRPGQEWTLKTADTAAMAKDADAAFLRGDYANMMGSVFRMYFGGEEYGQPFRKLDNELLSIKQMGDPELKALIAKIMGE